MTDKQELTTDKSNVSHIDRSKSQLDVTEIIIDNHEHLANDSFISDIVCDDIGDLGNQSNVSDAETVSCTPTEFSSDSIQRLSQQTSSLSLHTKLSTVNEALGLLDESPIPTRKIEEVDYLYQKANNTGFYLKKKFGVLMNSDFATVTSIDDACDMIEKLYIKFHEASTSWPEKIQILTLMPSSWENKKIMEVMDATDYMVRTAKKLLASKGILSKPGPRYGHPVPNEMKSAILAFYNEDEVSSPMPGMKDCISIRNEEGNKTKVQKRLVLSNLKELFQLFRERNPNVKIGFSTFADLRPLHCILPGGSGTHTVCVDTVHQNVKLMMLGGRISSLTKDQESSLHTYDDCINLILCPNPTSSCYLGNCRHCPQTDKLHNLLTEVMEQKEMDSITYSQWVTTPRASLEKFTHGFSEFVDDFCVKIASLSTHNFIAKEQSAYLRTLKISLLNNEFIIICDFAENYAFVVQSAAPGFHWNNDQATVYPVVIYYKLDNELVHKSLVVISEAMSHDAVAVRVFSGIIIDYVKTLSESVSIIYYFSDGAPQQFKNYKKFVNLYYHEQDYGIKAEWNYFATAHGKGPCDGVGGIVKRMAARASLQLPYDQQITTTQEFFVWASQPNNLPNIEVPFLSKSDYQSMENQLLDRFNRAKSIPHTQKIHCAIPNTDNTLSVKRYSGSTEVERHNIIKTMVKKRKRVK